MTVTQAQRHTAADRARYLGLLHVPYVHGGMGEDGTDCSGLVTDAWGKAGIVLPHNAAMQAQWFQDRHQLVPWTLENAKKMRPGDVVFYKGSDGGTTPETLGHDAVFLTHFEGLFVVAQATDTEHGSEVIRARKYEDALFIGHMR